MGGTRSAKAASALLALSLLIVASVVVPANKGGMGDGEVETKGCICHTGTKDTTLSVRASFGNVDTRWVATGGTVEMNVDVNLKGAPGDIVGVGLFVLDGDDYIPITVDGWSLESDPTGGKASYIEMAVQAGTDRLPLRWTLGAPPTTGHHTIVAGAFHGGGTPVKAFSSPMTLDVIAGGNIQVLDVAYEPEGMPGVPLPVVVTTFSPSSGTSVKVSFKPIYTGGSETIDAVRDDTFQGGVGFERFSAILPAQVTVGDLTFHVQTMAGGSTSSWPTKGDATINISFAVHPTVEHIPPSTGIVFGKGFTLDFVVDGELDPPRYFFQGLTTALSYRWEGLREPYYIVGENTLSSIGPHGHYSFDIPSVEKAGKFEYSLIVNITFTRPGPDLLINQTNRFDYSTEVLPDIEITSIEVLGEPKKDGEVEVEVTVIDHSNVPIFDIALILTDYPVDGKDADRPTTFQRSNVSLLPDKENKVRIWWRPGDEGERRLLVVTSLPPGRPDPDASNDRISLTVHVRPRGTDLDGLPLRDLLELMAASASFVVAFAMSRLTSNNGHRRGGGPS